MNWRRFAMGCGMGAGFVSSSIGIAFLISLNPPVVMGLLMLAVILFFGWMVGTE